VSCVTRPGRGNVPAELSGFVGRRAEVSEVRRLLERNRLVTLTGMGGVGKTRLALKVAESARRGFRDGVWLVELAATTDANLVPSAVAGVFGVADRSDRSAVSTLLGYLEDKRLLLVLDNCEHLVDVCAVLAAKLLACAPDLRVLATSRQPLRVDGEQVVPVVPLSTPDPHDLPMGDLAQFEAVELFVQRARAVVPTFEVTEANRAALAKVCRRVEGIPLAIELAAARVPVLSVAQILLRLDDRFALLTKKSRIAPDRHRTLTATLDWSYELCSPPEQLLWTRASVFAGGFDLDAAEQICAGDGIDRGEVFELVSGLVDKSILGRHAGIGSAARYGLLETVRDYGHQQLAGSGLQDTVRDRHREYYLELARQGQAGRVSDREVEWLLRLRREWPNLRAAMESGLARQDFAHSTLDIALALRDLWFGTGRHREGLHWLSRAIAASGERTPARVIALTEAAYFAMRLGEAATCDRMLTEARALADRLDDVHARLVVTHTRGTLALLQNPPDLPLAQALTEAAAAGYRLTGDLRRQINALQQLFAIALFLGETAAAADHAEQCRGLAEAHGAEWTRSWGLVLLATLRARQGEPARTEALLYEAMPTHLLVGDSYAAGISLELLAWAATATGHPERGARLLGACEVTKRLNGPALAQQAALAVQHDQAVRAARQALGDDAYGTLFDEGAQFTLDEAIRYGLGEQPPRPPAATPGAAGAGLAPLTPREQEIAELVTQGLTNKQIAARLVISQRTAEGHVENILTKLGFTNRAQISRWITERGGTTP
jgi:predicted ATPase/DNA-binding CsgD family transcriptional regulator